MALSTEPPEVQLRSDAAASRIENLVAATAPALSADGAAFMLASPRGTDRLACVGAATSMVWSPELTAAALGSRLLLIERSEKSQSLSRSLFDSDIRFFASLRIGTEEAPLGLLVICGRDPRSLSGAQEYVLATFAAQIADQFELEELRAYRNDFAIERRLARRAVTLARVGRHKRERCGPDNGGRTRRSSRSSHRFRK